MPLTRSITRNHATKAPPAVNPNLKRGASNSNKRQLEEAESDSAAAAATKRTKKSSSSSKNRNAKPEIVAAVPRPLIKPTGDDLAPLPAKLTFSLEDAKSHLVKADGRFGDVFSRLPCKPFERVEGVHPFRSVDLFRFMVSDTAQPGLDFLTMWAPMQNAVHFHNVRRDASLFPSVEFFELA
jgi:DNA-3-methyladenine glycosylase II